MKLLNLGTVQCIIERGGLLSWKKKCDLKNENWILEHLTASSVVADGRPTLSLILLEVSSC